MEFRLLPLPDNEPLRELEDEPLELEEERPKPAAAPLRPEESAFIPDDCPNELVSPKPPWVLLPNPALTSAPPPNPFEPDPLDEPNPELEPPRLLPLLPLRLWAEIDEAKTRTARAVVYIVIRDMISAPRARPPLF